MTDETREHYNPKGIEFIDKKTLREMKFVTEGHSKGWICYKHPDGQWVTLREATEEDKRILGVQSVEIRDVMDGAHGVTCPECEGRRYVIYRGDGLSSGSLPSPEKCRTCKGSGVVKR